MIGKERSRNTTEAAKRDPVTEPEKGHPVTETGKRDPVTETGKRDQVTETGKRGQVTEEHYGDWEGRSSFGGALRRLGRESREIKDPVTKLMTH
jgi:hypothetical protein